MRKLIDLTTSSGGTAPTMPKLNVSPLGVTIDENGIASDFKKYNDTFTNYGGFTINTGGKLLDAALFHQNQTGFQIAFHSPATKQELILCGPADSTTASNQHWQLTIDSNFSGITIKANGYNNKTAAYAFEPDTDYIVRYYQKWANSQWSVYTEISTDGGETFTEIKSENGRLDTDNYGIIAYCGYTQFGYVYNGGTMTAYPSTINLKKTGFINKTNNFVYMFAE